jgi:hypothetical protein
VRAAREANWIRARVRGRVGVEARVVLGFGLGIALQQLLLLPARRDRERRATLRTHSRRHPAVRSEVVVEVVVEVEVVE